jgi:hypothetical protein
MPQILVGSRLSFDFSHPAIIAHHARVLPVVIASAAVAGRHYRPSPGAARTESIRRWADVRFPDIDRS